MVVQNSLSINAGCRYLKQRIEELKIKAHLFGHIHEGYGKKDIGYTALNSSVLNHRYQLVNQPQVMNIAFEKAPK